MDSALIMRDGAYKAGTQTQSILRSLKLFTQYISGYPKIVYVPFLLASSAAYGFHSVKKTNRP